jgi:hypothetical protein
LEAVRQVEISHLVGANGQAGRPGEVRKVRRGDDNIEGTAPRLLNLADVRVIHNHLDSNVKIQIVPWGKYVMTSV